MSLVKHITDIRINIPWTHIIYKFKNPNGFLETGIAMRRKDAFTTHPEYGMLISFQDEKPDPDDRVMSWSFCNATNTTTMMSFGREDIIRTYLNNYDLRLYRLYQCEIPSLADFKQKYKLS